MTYYFKIIERSGSVYQDEDAHSVDRCITVSHRQIMNCACCISMPNKIICVRFLSLNNENIVSLIIMQLHCNHLGSYLDEVS